MKIFSLLLISILLFGCTTTPNRTAPTVPIAATKLPAKPNSPALSTPTEDLGKMSAFATETSPTPLPSVVVGNDSNECENSFYPVVDGASWDYKISTGQEAAHSMAVDENNAFTITIQGGESTFTVDGKCTDEGVVIMETPGSATTYSGDQGSSVVSTTDVSGVTIPKDIKINDTWSQTINVKTGETSSVIQSDYTAVGFENISVPAGNFYVLKIEQSGYIEIFGQKIKVHGYQWFAEGVGTVKSAMDGAPSAELVSFDIPN